MFLNIRNVRTYKIQILSAFIAALGMLSDGMQFAWSSPAVPKLTAEDSVIPISKSEAMWVSQFYLVGNIAGVPLSFIVFRNMGRKSSILLACVAITLAWLGNITARSALMLYLSRFIGGIGKHMIFVSVPMYLGEMADPKIRGILGTFIYMMVQLGSLIIYSITPFYPLYVSCLVGLTAALIPLMTIKFLPESPYYLLKKGDMDRAKESLQILRGTDDVMAEFKELDIAVKRQMSAQGSFLQLFTDHNNLKALAILVFLRISQAMTGVAVIIMNVHTIFEEVGDHISPDTSAIIYAVLMFSSTILTVGIMDRFGRKSLMIFSSIVTALALSLLGAFFYLKLTVGFNTDVIYWLPITCTCLFVYGYRIGLGTVPIIMVGELLNVNVKVPGVVISDLSMSISSFTANLIFQYTEEMYGMYIPFWIFATCCVVCAVFSILFVPETRKKSLEEIQFIIMNKNEAGDKKKDDLDKIETSPV